MTVLPFILNLGAFSRGGERKRLLGSFTCTYSSNLILSCVLLVGTFVCPRVGYMASITGGIVSFGPPLGGVWVFAQECENMVDPMITDIGMIGKSAFRILFIFVCL